MPQYKSASSSGGAELSVEPFAESVYVAVKDIYGTRRDIVISYEDALDLATYLNRHIREVPSPQYEWVP